MVIVEVAVHYIKKSIKEYTGKGRKQNDVNKYMSRLC